MKKIGLLIVAIFSFLAVQAQEEFKKDTYIKKGDVIEVVQYHENGVISQEGFYTLDGVTTGDWTSYDRNGVKIADAKYDNGEKVGTWFFWKENTLTEVDYQLSQIVAVNTWKSNNTQLVSK